MKIGIIWNALYDANVPMHLIKYSRLQSTRLLSPIHVVSAHYERFQLRNTILPLQFNSLYYV